ncbi:hypothetical protein SK128_023234, partial [Halocaridina rubra]
MKSSTTYLQQYYIDKSVDAPEEISQLQGVLCNVIQHSSCPLDLCINCGQLMATIHKWQEKDNFHLFIQALVDRSNPYENLAPLAQLAILNGVLCVISLRDLYVKHSRNDKPIGIQILRAILSPCYQLNEGTLALIAIRMLQRWTERTLEAVKVLEGLSELSEILHPSSHLMSSILDYLWLSWDHFLDSVKHATKECFQNIIRIQSELLLDDSKEYYRQLCESFLSKSVPRNYQLSAVSCMVSYIGCEALLMSNPRLPESLLTCMKNPSLSSHAAELLESLFTVHAREVSQKKWQDTWLSPFILSFTKEMQTFGYELLFKKLLFTCPDSVDDVVSTLLESVNDLSSKKLCLLIMCIKIGRKSSYWHMKCKDRLLEDVDDYWKYILHYPILALCLSHMDESVHSAAFSLLSESPKSTELPEKRELNLILNYYSHCITIRNPSYKQHLVKSTKKLLMRIKEGLRVLSRSMKNTELYRDIINDLSSFCTSLFLLLMQNIQSGANMARRGTSLLILECFMDIFAPDGIKLFGIDNLYQSQEYVDTLLCILDDSYESNKLVALKLLQSLSPDKTEYHNERKVQCLLSASRVMASSCRPPDSLTASYIIKSLVNDPFVVKIFIDEFASETGVQSTREVFFEYLLKLLQNEVSIAKTSLLKAAASSPCYGLLLCLRGLLMDIPPSDLKTHYEFWKNEIKNLVDICHTISELVAPVVRNSSPEGHLPMDLNPESLANLKSVLQMSLGCQFNQNEDLLSDDVKPDELVKAQAVSAQMLLLCAWRCVKEISLILGDLILNFSLPPDPLSVLTVEDVTLTGKYFLKQLSETKHRGAFEQSYVGFVRICERLWKCSNEELSALPENWLISILRTIEFGEDNCLCATRRSAGVPFIVQAVLSSEPSIRGGLCLQYSMNTLLKLATESQFTGMDVKLHSFNILRAIYRESKLGDLVVLYAPAGVMAAIEGYKSATWAERNAAALLFASLITRMFGVKKTQDDLNHKNAMSALVFFRRYPELYLFLISELEAGASRIKEGMLVPALFPILLLFARLSPSPIEGRSSTVSLNAFTPAVIQCSFSSVLQLRGLAAQALLPLVTPDNIVLVIDELCTRATLRNQNALHGCLLSLLKLLKCYGKNIVSDDKYSRIISCLISLSWTATNRNPCLLTRCCALQLFALLSTNRILSADCRVLSSIYTDAFSLVSVKDSSVLYEPWSALCQKAAAEFVLSLSEHFTADISESICLLLSSASSDVRLVGLNYTLKFHETSPIIFHKILEQIHNKEFKSDCLIKSFRIVTEYIRISDRNELYIEMATLTHLLQYSVRKANEESCIELISEIIGTSSAIIASFLSM